ncbi:MAG: hypothetical protein NVSMB2_22480 [Chloroflexota bacterium]
MISVTLYTRPGCHLCETAQAELARLQRQVPHTLGVVDISDNAELEARYGERIPVLLAGGQEFSAPLPYATLERALRAALTAKPTHAVAISVGPAERSGDPAAAFRGCDTAISAPPRPRSASAAAVVGTTQPHLQRDEQMQPTQQRQVQRGEQTQQPPVPAGALDEARPPTQERNRANEARPTRVSRWFEAIVAHWLAALNTALGVLIAGAFAAPVLAAAGLTNAATNLYALYHLTCHQWGFRSFFLFGAPTQPLTIYSRDDLAGRGVDPFGFVGNNSLGWKMAMCERDIAIYAALLTVSLLYSRRAATLPTLHPLAFVALALPMAADGFTQLFGWRESTWALRVLTGALFGIGCAWFVLPTLDAMIRRESRQPLTAHKITLESAPDNTLGSGQETEVLCRPARG